MLKIVGKFLVELRTMLDDKNVVCEITDPALDHLVENGFDSKMGARPMQRYIDKHIKRPLSKLLLFGDLRDGGTLTIDVADEKIILNTKKIKVTDEKTAEVTNN
jgi:ATP-dependent Clp protease ATP-binding subunit ClpA